MSSTCTFDRAWIGPCGKPANYALADQPLCSEHITLTCCSCKAPATRECDFCGQFVCGFPLCDDCVHTVDAHGKQDHGPRRADPVPGVDQFDLKVPCDPVPAVDQPPRLQSCPGCHAPGMLGHSPGLHRWVCLGPSCGYVGPVDVGHLGEPTPAERTLGFLVTRLEISGVLTAEAADEARRMLP